MDLAYNLLRRAYKTMIKHCNQTAETVSEAAKTAKWYTPTWFCCMPRFRLSYRSVLSFCKNGVRPTTTPI